MSMHEVVRDSERKCERECECEQEFMTYKTSGNGNVNDIGNTK